MIFRKPLNCGIMCKLSRIIRRNRWLKISKPIVDMFRPASFKYVGKKY